MSTELTITVADFFGDKDITEEEFVKQWVDHVAQAKNLDYSHDWQETMQVMLNTVEMKAKQEFSRILNEQSS